MKRACCLAFFVFTGALCFAQISLSDSAAKSGFFSVADKLDYSPGFSAFRPVPLADESAAVPEDGKTITGDDKAIAEDIEDKTIFDNSPQWVKDLRRGEIVFFGSLPFTVFFSRFFIDLARMGMHDWDRRYAPWPLKSAGGVSMTSSDLVMLFSVAGAASLTISIADHFIVRHKRKAAAEAYDSGVTEHIVIEEDAPEEDSPGEDNIGENGAADNITEDAALETDIIQNANE